MAAETTQTPRIERIEKVWTPDAKLWTPHEDGETVFAFPSFGPGIYLDVGQRVLSNNLQTPVGEHSSDLVHAAYCGPEMVEDKPFRDSPPVANVRDIMRNDWIWVARRKLWTPEGFGKLGAGIFSVYDEKGIGLSKELVISELEEELKNSVELREGVISTPNGRVRFASESSYTLGDHTHDSIEDDGNVITDYGVEGAGRLSDVSRVIGGNPYVYGLDVSQLKKPEQRVSALGEDGGWLHVRGDFGGSGNGHAFGVLK